MWCILRYIPYCGRLVAHSAVITFTKDSMFFLLVYKFNCLSTTAHKKLLKDLHENFVRDISLDNGQGSSPLTLEVIWIGI